jgi:exodeoxyribonuclease-3
LRVVTWNIWNGGERRLDAIERMLRDQDADVVALQEANDRSAVETIGAHLGMEVVYGEANSPYAVAWLSRLPVTCSENHRLPVLEKTLLEIEVEGLQLFATHLSAGRTKAHEPHRVAEAKAILEIADDGDVLVGDFNAVRPNDAIGTPPPEEELDYASRRPIELVLEAGFADCFRELHPEDRGWTYLSWHPFARIDFVFASERVEVERCDVLTDADGASDHFPLVAEVRLAPAVTAR